VDASAVGRGQGAAAGHCPMMRSGSSRGARTRKTRPPHEIRHCPPYADPEIAAHRILEIANSVEVEPIQGRIHIERINEPFLFRDRGSPAEYGAGVKLAIDPRLAQDA
jgi:hypothetical protein